MSRQYKRAYSLVINDGSTTKTISELRIKFNITKSLFSYPNLAQIELYNPNTDTLSLLENSGTEISLNAGYQGNIRLIFKGQIRNVFQTKAGPDRIVLIYAGDGQQDWENSIFNKTLSENIAIRQIVEELALTFQNTEVGSLQGLDAQADKLRGQTLSGATKQILDKLAEDYGFQWSIQDGVLITVPNDELLEGRDLVLINPATGMIGSPTITELGVNVTTLLNPQLLPNAGFKVESSFANVSIGGIEFREFKRTRGEGVYKAFQVVFSGDTHANNWFSIVDGRVLNA